MPKVIHYRHYAHLCPKAKLDYPAGYRTRHVKFTDADIDFSSLRERRKRSYIEPDTPEAEDREETVWRTAYQNLPQAKQRHNIQDVNCPACLIEVTTVCINQLDDLGELPIDTGDDEDE